MEEQADGTVPGSDPGASEPGRAAERARSLIEGQRVMVLASCRNQVPWTAPVYYLYRDSGFWFFSGQDSRHIREALDQDGMAGASIFRDDGLPGEIKGVQMTGRIAPPGTMAIAAETALAYARRFSIPAKPGDALSMIMTRYRARLYCFRPDMAVFMDNSVCFGHREIVTL